MESNYFQPIGLTQHTADSLNIFGIMSVTCCPALAERCQREIDRVLEGKDRVSFEDRHNMPYVQVPYSKVLFTIELIFKVPTWFWVHTYILLQAKA